MKKIFLSICVLFAMLIGFAQKKWAIEIKTGVNTFSNAGPDNPPSVSFKSNSGFMGGALGTYFISNRFAVKSGFLYEFRRFKMEYKSSDSYTYPTGLFTPYTSYQTVHYTLISDLKYTISVLTIPFYGQYEIGNKVKGLFYAGPYVSIPMNTKRVSVRTPIGYTYPNIKNTNVEFGFSTGAGLIIPMNHVFDFVGNANYKVGINKSLNRLVKGYLYDLGASVGLRYHF